MQPATSHANREDLTQCAVLSRLRCWHGGGAGRGYRCSYREEPKASLPHHTGKSGSSYCRAPGPQLSCTAAAHYTIRPSHRPTDSYSRCYGDVVKRHSRLS